MSIVLNLEQPKHQWFPSNSMNKFVKLGQDFSTQGAVVAVALHGQQFSMINKGMEVKPGNVLKVEPQFKFRQRLSYPHSDCSNLSHTLDTLLIEYYDHDHIHPDAITKQTEQVLSYIRANEPNNQDPAAKPYRVCLSECIEINIIKQCHCYDPGKTSFPKI